MEKLKMKATTRVKRKRKSSKTSFDKLPNTNNDTVIKRRSKRLQDRIDDENSKIFSIDQSLTPVDKSFQLCRDDYYVVDRDEQTSFSATLVYCDIETNTNNYHILQLLKHRLKNEFKLWLRKGRIGCKFYTSLVNCATYSSGVQSFSDLFFRLTGNSWNNLNQFEYQKKKYNMVEVKNQEFSSSALIKKEDSDIVSFMNLIVCEKGISSQNLASMKAKNGSTPLGFVSTKQVDEAYDCLKKIAGSRLLQEIIELSNTFYMLIPHYFYKTKIPKKICSKSLIAGKCKLLELLKDPKGSYLLPTDKPRSMVLQNAYYQLKYRPQEIPSSGETSSIFSMIHKCIQRTHGPTHDQFSLHLKKLFMLSQPPDMRFNSEIGNRVMLWHGSRLSNWHSILQNGFRVKPLEAKANGAMFGDGVYFADIVSKASNYCYASETENVGLIVLCDVALGREEIRREASNKPLSPGFNSVRGEGFFIPNPLGDCKMFNNEVTLKTGKPISRGNSEDNFQLYYNEYVVYNIEQIRPVFLLLVKFISPTTES